MKLRDVIAEYVAHQQSLGQNPNSRKSLLLTFNRNAGNEIEVQNVNTDRVLTFLGRPTTDYWRQKYSALACFYRYAISRGYATSSPLPRRISRAFPQFVPYIYSHDDVRRLLEATQSYRRRHTLLEPHTFRAIMILLYGAGLRISEALSLRVSDVDLSRSLLLIRKTSSTNRGSFPLDVRCNERWNSSFEPGEKLITRRRLTPRFSSDARVIG
jgi:integrase/recombinase XerD